MHRSPTVNIKRWQAGVAIQRRKTKATYDSFTVYMAEVERPLRSPRKKSHSKRPCWSDSDPHAEVGGTASELSISREWRAEGDGGGNHCQNILNVCSFECSLVTDKLNWKSQKSHKRKLTGGLSCPCVCVLCLFPCLLNSSWFYNHAGDKTGSRSCRTGLSRPGHEVLLTWNQVDTVSVHSSKFSSFLYKYWNMISYFLLLLSHLSCQVNCTSNAASH